MLFRSFLLEKWVTKYFNKLESYDFRSPNMVGHFVLLKYELQGIPIYHKYVLEAYKAIYDSIITSQFFLWRGVEKVKKRALLS